MDGFKTLEELQAEEKVRDDHARMAIEQDISGLASGIVTSFGDTRQTEEMRNTETFLEMDLYTSQTRDETYTKGDVQISNTYSEELKTYEILDQERHKNFMQLITNSKTIMNEQLVRMKATEDEKTFMNAAYGKYADRIVKGYSDGYLTYKTPLGENNKSFIAAMNNILVDHKLQKDIDKYRQQFPIYGFIQATNKQYDTLIDYWEEKKKNPASMTPEKEQQYREKLYESIVSGCVLFDKMMSSVEDPAIAEEIGKDRLLGNHAFHLHPLSSRGMRQTNASLETYKKCLENGWAIDDIPFVASYKLVIDDVETACIGNGSLNYKEYEKYDPPKYRSEEQKQYLQDMKKLYDEVTTNPLRSKEQRKDWLDRMDSMVKEGAEKGYLTKPGYNQTSEIVRYYNQTAQQRPLRDKLIESEKETAIWPSVDVEKALANRKAKDERNFERRFNVMESRLNTQRTDWWFGSENKEHKNLRIAVEELKRFYAENKGKERNTPEEQEKYARKLLNRLDAVEHYAKIYIEKKVVAKTEAGNERIRGAVNFKDFAKEQKRNLLKSMKDLKTEGEYSTIDSMRTRLTANKAAESMAALEKMDNMPTDARQKGKVVDLAMDILLGRIAVGNGIKGKEMLAEYGVLEMKRELYSDKNYVKLMNDYIKEPGMTGKKLVEELSGDRILQRLGNVKNNVERKNAQIEQNGETKEFSQPKKVTTPPIMMR